MESAIVILESAEEQLNKMKTWINHFLKNVFLFVPAVIWTHILYKRISFFLGGLDSMFENSLSYIKKKNMRPPAGRKSVKQQEEWKMVWTKYLDVDGFRT